MLPTEPPLSLHRLVAPVPPARPQESAAAARQTPPATESAPAPVKPPTAFERLVAAGHDQVGNAAMAGAAARAGAAAPGAAAAQAGAEAPAGAAARVEPPAVPVPVPVPAVLLPEPVRKAAQAPASS
ncbi:hypothetical protein [Streptomyces sp. enrichment culture]|uniref:hypothetical protein n=1 Tax=Streptomyces sp. enrichment culture TaxID=1795815 RepID=UPI003F54E261